MLMVATVHLKNVKLNGPAKCIAYLETIKLPDQIKLAVIASSAPNWYCLLNCFFNFVGLVMCEIFAIVTFDSFYWRIEITKF